MRKLGWFALRAAVAAFVLGSVALLAANLYVQSYGVQQRIRTTLAVILRTPVSLRKTTVTPWDGLRLDGVALHKEAPDRADGPKDFLTAASFRVKIAWWPLVSQHQLVVEQVLLDQPRLTLRESPDRPPAQEPSAEPPATLAAETPRESPLSPAAGEPPTAPDAASPTDADGIPAPRMPAKWSLPAVKKMRVRHGKVALYDTAGHARWQVDEINADGSVADPTHARGAFWFARAASDELPGAALTDYWTALDYDREGGLTARDGRGKIADGALKTEAHLQPQGNRLFFTTLGSLENVALGKLMRPAPDGLPLAQGQLHGDIDLRGFTDDSASITGGGRLWLSGAKVQNFPLLNIIGQVLRIADLSQLEFKQAQMVYHVEQNVLWLDGLTLVSNDSQMVMRGQYLLAEDRLDFHGRLTIDRAISHQLPQFIESNFTRCGPEAPGSRYLDFDVNGTRDEPKSNLYDRLTAGPMKGLLDNLLSPKPKLSKVPRPDGGKKARPSPDAVSPKP